MGVRLCRWLLQQQTAASVTYSEAYAALYWSTNHQVNVIKYANVSLIHTQSAPNPASQQQTQLPQRNYIKLHTLWTFIIYICSINTYKLLQHFGWQLWILVYTVALDVFVYAKASSMEDNPAILDGLKGQT